MILQEDSISFPTLRIVILFNWGFRCLSRFAFECSAIQQRYGSSIRSACAPDFKLTGIQIAIKLMPGTTNGEHRKLIDVKTMSLFVYEVQFLLSGVMSVFLNYKLQKILSDVLPNQQSNRKYVQRCTCLRMLRYPIKLSLQYYIAIAMAFWRGAVARLSRHD